MVSHRLSSKQIKNIRLYTEDGFTKVVNKQVKNIRLYTEDSFT